MLKSLLFRKAALWFAFAMCLGSLGAQTVFSGPVGGSWHTAANWSNGLPAAGNNAIVPGGASVVIGAALTVNFQLESYGNLTLDAAMTINAGGNFIQSGALAVSSTGSLTNNAAYNNYSTAVFAGPATFTNNAGASFANFGAFTLSTTLVNHGDVVNNGTIDATNGTLLSHGTFDNRQTLNTKTLTVSAAGTYLNNFGATLNITGTGATLTADGLFTNNGFVNVKPGATAALNNAFANNGQLTNEGTLTLAASGQIQNNGTVTNKGTMTLNGQFQNQNSFFNEGTAEVYAAFAQNNTFENRAGATFNLRIGSSMHLNFGSQLTNLGAFTNFVGMTSVGTLTNNGTFTNKGTFDNNSGGTLRNLATFQNDGTVNSQNQVFDDGGTWTNAGVFNIQSGSIFQISAAFINTPSGKVTNLYEILVRSTGTFTNNGVLPNNIRLFVDGALTNNAYILNTGDVFVRAGGSLTNKEVFENIGGNVDNAGTLVNQDQFILDECSTLKNTGTINNTGGSLTTKSIIIQRGTLTGNAISNTGGYIHTGATSAAPALCLNRTVSANDMGEVKVYATSLVAFSSFSNCGNIIFTGNGIPRPVFSCADIGTIKNVNVKLLMRLGDSLTCVSQVTPADSLAPNFANCPFDQVIFTPNTTATATWTAPTAADNCTANPTVTSTHNSGASFPIGITGVTYTAKDAKNNAQICQFKVSVVKTAGTSNCTGDTQPPVIANCPPNTTVASDFPSTKVTWTQPTLTDNCFPISLTSTRNSGSDFYVGASTVRYTAKDGNGNTSTCQFTVTVTQNNLCATDTQKPVIANCPTNIYAPTNPDIGGAVIRWAGPAVSDNCSFGSLTQTHYSGTIFANGSYTVVYTANDLAGNVSTCSFKVTVGTDPCPGDVTGPAMANCPANIVKTTSGSSSTATWTGPVFSENCTPVSSNSNYSSGATFPLGVTTVNHTASDGKGNKTVCSFTVTVTNTCFSDLTPPTITGCPANLTVGTAGTSAAATWTAPTAADPCGLVSFETSYLPGASFPLGQTTVVYTATDLRANTASCAFVVNVVATPACAPNASPINNATNVAPTAVALSWNSAVGATAYDIYLGTANPPTTLLAQNVVTTVYNIPSLLQGTKYYWYVVPKNVAGAATGCASNVTNFTTSGTNNPTCKGTPGTGLTRQVWTNVAGSVVANLTSLPTYPNSPNTTDVVAGSVPAWNSMDNYGSRVRGFITPTVSGDYYLFATGDDETLLYFSNGTDPNAKTLVASVPYWTGQTEFFKYTSQQSAILTLTAGQDYYIELLHKEGGGGDGWGIFWCPPGATSPAQIPVAHLAPYQVGCTGTPNIPCGGTVGAGLTRQVWTNIAGSVVANLTSSPNYPNSPNTTDVVAGSVPVWNGMDNYGSRVRGFITPTVSGSYFLFATGDDETQLYISNGTDPSMKTLAAHVPYFTGQTEFYKYASQKSDVLTLTAGQSYYIELLHKEGGGGDGWGIFWCPPGTSTPVQIPVAQLTPYQVDCAPAGSCAGNYVTNAGFENGLTENYWFQNATITSDAKNGSKAVQICNAAGGLGTYLAVVPGQTITFSAAAKLSGTLGWTGMGIAFYNTDAVWISEVSQQITTVSNTYTTYTKSATVPANAVFAEVWVWTDGGTGCLKVDDLCTTLSAPTTCTPNVVGNSGFENDLTWYWYDAGTTISTTNKTAGYKGAQICSSTEGGLGQPSYAIPGFQYTFTLKAKTSGSPAYAEMQLEFFDANWNLIGSATPKSIAASSYTTFSTSAVAPVGTAYVQGLIWKGAYGCVYTDEWSIVGCPASVSTCNKTALLVVGNTTLGAGDTAIKNRLQALGITVTVKSDAAVLASDATGKGLVIISSTSLSTNIGTRLTSVAVPLINYEPALMDDLKMTGTVAYTDFGDITEYRVNVLAPNHPIGGNLSGWRNVLTASKIMTWGKPSASATKVAEIPNNPGKNAIFCYETAASMVGLNAPARRVGFFLHDVAPSCLTVDGWKFFDNAVKWAMNCPTLNNLGLAAPNSADQSLVFNARRKNFDAELSWISNAGSEAHYFILERSADGRRFSSIAKVDALAAADDEMLYFNELDEHPLPGANFYRVRLILRDGSERASEIGKVDFPAAAPFSVFPNPAATEAFVDLSGFAGKKVRISLVNQLGLTVQDIETLASDEPLALDLAGLPNGVFIVVMQSESGVSRSTKLVVSQRD